MCGPNIQITGKYNDLGITLEHIGDSNKQGALLKIKVIRHSHSLINVD
jgi:hypothetical protein